MINHVSPAREIRPAFPDLSSFESRVFTPTLGRATLWFKAFGVAGKDGLASLPKFEMFMFVAMMVLASA